MRRTMITTAASVAVLAVTPASALAKQHSKRHHSRTHHARTHRLRIRHERFGSLMSSSPTAPTTTAPTAGTVDSLVGNILTIRLADQTLVSGVVTPNTEIECAAPASTVGEEGDQSSGGDNSTSGGDNSTSGGDNSTSGDETGDNEAADVNDQSDVNDQNDVNDQGDDGAQNMTCTTANLVGGAGVSGAELGISSAGKTWEKVELAG